MNIKFFCFYFIFINYRIFTIIRFVERRNFKVVTMNLLDQIKVLWGSLVLDIYIHYTQPGLNMRSDGFERNFTQ